MKLGGTVSPSYISQFKDYKDYKKLWMVCWRYCTNCMTNDNLLKKGLELLDWLQEDLENVGAEDYHQLMRAWELKHRTLTSQCM